MFIRRNDQRHRQRPPALQTVEQRAFGQLKRPGGLGERQRHAVNFHAYASAPVVLLVFVHRPITIFRRIRAVVIAPFDRMTRRRSMAHVGQKIHEYIPSDTDRNTTASIAGEVMGSRISATIQHVAPRAIFRRSAHRVRGVAMALFHAMFTTQTLTTLPMFALQIFGKRDDFLTADASAIPGRATADIGGSCYDC